MSFCRPALSARRPARSPNTRPHSPPSEQAVDPPGQAKPDGEIFADYANRLGLKNKDGEPLVKWSTREECFEAWKECTRGRPCDYTGLSYAKLREGGIQLPCNVDAPDGTERLYSDLAFPTIPDTCEDYGHDIVTGASFNAADFKALGANGRAILKAAEWSPPHTEWAGGEYSLHADDRPHSLPLPHPHEDRPHTRAPGSRARTVGRGFDKRMPSGSGSATATAFGVSSPRGTIVVPARIGGPRQGVVFVPFHYGYWDTGDGIGPEGRQRAANELTITLWDPVSKQPRFKTAAVNVGASMKVGSLLAHLQDLERCYAETLRHTAERYKADHDVFHQCLTFAAAADKATTRLEAIRQRYNGASDWHVPLAGDGNTLLEDLRSLYLMANAVAVTWT